MRIPRPYAWLYLLLFGQLFLLMPQTGYVGDSACWINWATFIREHGLGNAYRDPTNNYNPLYQYVLWGFGAAVGGAVKIQRYWFWLKGITLLFDFAGALLVAWRVPGLGEAARRFRLSLLLLCNVGYLYNTLAWGQVDAIFSALALLALLLALRGRATLSVLSFVLALNAKTQAIIFLPPLLLLWAPTWARSVRVLGTSLATAVGTQLLVMVPFLLAGNGALLLRVFTGVTETYPVISMSAYNLWVLLFGNAATHGPESQSDSLRFGGLAYRHWGLLLFAASSALVLLPVLALALRALLTRQAWVALTTAEWAIVLLSCALVPFCFTYFNTQMHERYWHPALLPLAAYSFLTRRYALPIAFSIIYLLQLEAVLHALPLAPGILPFNSLFLAVLFTALLVAGVGELYRLVREQRLFEQLRRAWGMTA